MTSYLLWYDYTTAVSRRMMDVIVMLKCMLNDLS
jgi:hypothetical protein